MTKKQAIDRALKALPLSNHRFYREVMENLWTEARIAGLREAAKLWVVTPEACRERANALAKKARSRRAPT